jgi:DNA-binding NtrC family response regulator
MDYHNQTIEGFKIKDPKMKKIYKEIEKFAKVGFNCILYGPSGSGKEFLAKHYHKFFKKYHANQRDMFDVNCQNLYKLAAQSELFGHVKGAFTDAHSNRDGLFKTAKDGVIFLDEIGELSAEMQNMLLRAIDPGKAKLLGSDETYNTNNVSIIGATDKDPNKLNAQLLYRMGQTLVVPGLDDRKADIPGAIDYFIHNMFRDRIKIADNLDILLAGREIGKSNKEIKAYISGLCQKIANKLTPLVKKQKWPGNFRSLNSVISSALVLVEIKEEDKYIREVKEQFLHYADIEKARQKTTKKETDIDFDIMQAIESHFPRWKRDEKRKWAEILTEMGSNSFLRTDIEDDFELKARSLQNRLKVLVKAGIISSSGNRGDVYRVDLRTPVSKQEKIPQKPVKRSSLFGLPATIINFDERRNEVNEILKFLEKDTHVFISGDARSGKTTVSLVLGQALQELSKDVFYFELNEAGMHAFIKEMQNFLEQEGFEDIDQMQSNQAFMLHTDAAALSGYINNYFSDREAPIFLLDNLQKLNSREDLDTLHVILQYWKKLIFVFTGDKMSNKLIFGEKARIVEFRINAKK